MTTTALIDRVAETTIPRSRSDILASLPALVAAIAPGAAQRDLERRAPLEAFALIRQSGLGSLRIAQEHGGPDGSIADVIEAITSLAAADSNVAHSLRSHFNTTELLRLQPGHPPRPQHQQVLSGALFGGAFTELGTAKAGISTSTLSRCGDAYRLNGKKYYATGTAYCDYANIYATDEAQQALTVTIPVKRRGVRVLDDWDGMGQRLTASGGLELEDVQVFADEISYAVHGQLHGRHASAFRQLFLVATAAGIVRNIAADAVHYVRHLGRPAMHSTAERSRDDPLIQGVIGDLCATSHAIDQLVRQTATQLDCGAAAIISAQPDADEVVLEGALATAQTQLIVSRLALPAAERLFEIGGASATSRQLNLDRHWRNLRTIFSHNPLLHKAKILGDYALNGDRTHLEEGRVF